MRFVATSSGLDFRRVLRRRDPLLDERVPVVAVRALPEELGAAVAAAHADVRIEVEDGVPRELAVAIDERRRDGAAAPSARQIAWWMPSACGFCTSAANSRSSASRGWPLAGQVARQRQPRAPVLRVLVDQPPAEAREALGRARCGPPAPRADRTPDRRDRARPRPAAPRSRRPRCSLPCATRTSPRFRYAGTARASRSIAASNRRTASR